MRGNHRIWGRQDYTPPPALTPLELERISTVTIRPREGTTTWFEGWSAEGLLLGYVSSRMSGQAFRRPWHDLWIPANVDSRPEDPRHARAILALLDSVARDAEDATAASLSCST